VRAIFHDEEEAAAVVGRLRDGGFEATAGRERFAGEDDDEDHPWAVVTDAPVFMVELLVEEYDGWLDLDDPVAPPAVPPAAPPAAPLDLPTGPRRIKGHFTDRPGEH
jgi:8-oxo-dGTP diphosphatase